MFIMFRLLVLCAILVFVEPYRRQCRTNPPFNGNQCSGFPARTNLEVMLQPIERDYIEQEEKFLQFCRENSPAIIGEMYGTDSYFLLIDLPEARNARITVRIKHKFLLTIATKADEVIFQDVKVLPDIANTEDAVWTYDQQTLKITIPYKVPLGETVGKTCGSVNSYEIDVPEAISSGFNYGSQDSRRGNGGSAARSSRFNPMSQDSTENVYDNPAARSSGSKYTRRSQASSRDNDGPVNVYESRPSGPKYRPQGSKQDVYDEPNTSTSGFQYRSL